MSRERFEELVADALDGIPAELRRLMRNVAILIDDDSPPSGPELFGLYEGVPLTARGDWYAGVLPDRITIYRLPVLRHCRTEEQIVEQVRITVAHEVGHHFGIDDHRLGELGYG